MPVVLTEKLAREWIRDGLTEEQITEIAGFQYPSSEMDAYTIEKGFRTSDDPTYPFDYKELPTIKN
jgi:hypothetical protein